ncbi:MAG TPA: hypothetical protein VI407_07470 [Erythrobacter sp.]|uniref:hypothetical protein n=1 Tax=Erythrobacter colymbi TaxID=1161202 RepID=UPI001F0B4FCC|nr:hypothetical protein [Erythrobacter colymbi]
MDLIKSVTFGAILSAAIALVIGSQGTSAGPLAIHLVDVADARFFWSWPVFFSGTGLCFGMLLLQR